VAPNPSDPDAAQQQVLEHRTGALLMLGAAGTGKTAVLRERFARAIESGADPERIALVVGSDRARDEAQAALLNRLGRSLPALRVTTIHGLAFSIVSERFEALGYREPPRVLDAVRQFALVERLLEEERGHPERWPAYGGLLSLRGFADEIRQLLLRAAERVITPEEMRARAERRGLGGWGELAGFAARYHDELGRLGVLDFAGLLVRAAEAASIGPRAFDEVLIDDYQDWTFAAERLVSALGCPTVVVAGNETAHVFSFRGTTIEPLRRLLDDPSVVHVRLATDHRSRPGGVVVDAWTAAHASEEHRAIARELRRIHVEDDVSWSDLAVVVRRQSGDAQALLRALDDARIPRDAADPGLSPAAAPGTRPYVLALRWIVAGPETRDELAEVVLTSELGGIAPASARSLLRLTRARGLPTSAALEVEEGLGQADRASLAALRDALLEAERVAASAEDALRVLWHRLPCSAALVQEAETSIEARADLEVVRALTEAAAVSASSAEPGVEAFLASLGAAEGGPEAVGPTRRDGDAVRVLTAHASVGMEFDTVVVAGAQEANFPSLHRPEPMFDLDVLQRSSTRSETNRARIADERRLFGTVLSRARRRVLLTASHSHGSLATEGPVSRFAQELDVDWTPAPVPPYADPVSSEEAAAVWRRTLADTGASRGARVAALDGLLELGVDPRRWWFRRDWSPAPPRDEPHRLSFSRLDRLENCELQFALAEELGLDPGGGYQAWVGRLVHGLIERIEAGELERSPEAFAAAIEAAWEPQRFPSYAISEAERANATRVLVPNWFGRYGERPAEADGTERYFTFDLDGAVIRGKIDRIGPDEAGRRRITDFKTGKADNAGDPAESLQLGIYYLAVRECDELAPFRPVDAVELAFLAGTKGDAAEAKILEWAIDVEDEASYVTRMRSRVTDLVERVRTLAHEGSYTPSTAADCFFCRFQTMCSRYPQGAPVFETGAPVLQTAAPVETAAREPQAASP
jgi:superfamily I DNA/RNA helicase/RecB family exonuclease